MAKQTRHSKRSKPGVTIDGKARATTRKAGGASSDAKGATTTTGGKDVRTDYRPLVGPDAGATKGGATPAMSSAASGAAASGAAGSKTSSAGTTASRAASVTGASGAGSTAGKADPSPARSPSGEPRAADNDNRGLSPWIAGLLGGLVVLIGAWLLDFLDFETRDGGDDVATLRTEFAELRAASDGALTPETLDERVAAAVEEQLAAAGGGDAATVTALDERLAQLEAAEGQRQDAGGLTPEIEARIASIESAVGAGEGGEALAAFEQRLAALEGGTSGASSEAVTAAETRLAEIEEALGAGDGEAREALAALEQRLTQIDERVASLGTDQTSRLDTIGSEVATVGTSVAGTVAAIATVRDQIDAVRGTVAETQESVNAVGDRVDQTNERVASVSSDVSAIQERVETIRTTVSTLERRGGETSETLQTATTRLDDVAGRLDDLSGRTDEIATRLDGSERQLGELATVVEESRSDTTIARALAASNLKTAIDRGTSFAQELESYTAVASDPGEVEALREFAGRGVPTLAELTDRFPDTANAVLRADSDVPEDAGPLQQLLGSAKDVVSVRPIGGEEGEGTRAVVARMQEALGEADLERLLAEAEALEPDPKAAAEPFLEDVRARHTANTLIDRALAGAIRPQQG